MITQDDNRALTVLENAVRRGILRHLVREPHYPLQLANLLGVSQQAIVKHLKVLEDADFVMSEKIPSEKGGPPRKVYSVTQSFQLQVVVGPDIFRIQHRRLPMSGIDKVRDLLPESIKLSTKKLDKKNQAPVKDVINSLSEIDEEIERLDQQRDALLSMRQHVRMKAIPVVDDLLEYQHRSIVHHILDEPKTTLDPRILSSMMSINTNDIQNVIDTIRTRIMLDLSFESDSVLAGRPSTNLPWWAVKTSKKKKSGPF